MRADESNAELCPLSSAALTLSPGGGQLLDDAAAEVAGCAQPVGGSNPAARGTPSADRPPGDGDIHVG